MTVAEPLCLCCPVVLGKLARLYGYLSVNPGRGSPTSTFSDISGNVAFQRQHDTCFGLDIKRLCNLKATIHLSCSLFPS
jgi:hypothetical protein